MEFWDSIYSVVVKYSKVTVMVGQNRYSSCESQANFTHSNASVTIGFYVLHFQPVTQNLCIRPSFSPVHLVSPNSVLVFRTQ